MEDIIKAILIQLFILSLISERVTNFIKLNLQTLIERYGSKGLRNRLGNLRNREATEAKEKQRERGILNWAIVVGILVANVAFADLFYLITHGELQSQWVFSSIVGYCLTGLFISLGSKFWHDMLDIVLYTSNLKRKLADPNTFSIEKTEELEEFLKLTSKEITSFGLDQYKNLFASRSNVTYVTQSRKRIGRNVRDCIVIYLKDNDNSNIPSELPVSLPSGRKVMIPTFIVKNVKNIPQTQVESGDFIAPKIHDDQGTLCCGLTKNDTNYLLTCYHVLSGNKGVMNSTDFILNGDDRTDVKVEGIIKPVGNWHYGRRDEKLDIALVELKENRQDIFEPFRINKIPRTITEIEDATSIGQKQVTVFGDKSPNARGYIVGFTREPIEVQFGDGNFKMTELIEIADSPNHDTCNAITQGGDSGALVIDDLGFPIGMIFAANERFSYAIPMETILNAVEMEIITT